MMPFDDDDELRRQLTSLASDLDGLPGPSAARRRAAQRTRNQITGGVAAGVAVVALGGMGIVQFLGTSPGQMEPTDPTTPPATSEPTTAPTTDPSAPAPDGEIPKTASLLPTEIDTDQQLEWTARRVEDLPTVECVPNLPDDVLATRSVGYAGPRMQPDPAPDEFTNPTVRHDVLLVEPGTAADVQAELVGALNGCVPNEGGEGVPRPYWVDRFTVDNVGENMNETRYVADPFYDNTFATIVEYSVVSQDNLVSIVTRTSLNSEWHDEPDYVTPTNAAHRACTAVHGTTCVTGEPEPDELADYSASDPGAGPDPDTTEGSGDDTGTDAGDDTDGPAEPAATADQPFLPDDSVSEVGTYTEFRLAGTDDAVIDNVDAARLSACVDGLPSAEVTRHAHWVQEVGDGGFNETVLQMASTADAEAFVEAHSGRPQPCIDSGEPTIEVSNTDPEAVPGGDGAYAWSVEYTPTPDNPGTSGSFYGAAVAHQGNVVVILTLGAMGDPTDGGWTDWVQSRVRTALDAAVSE